MPLWIIYRPSRGGANTALEDTILAVEMGAGRPIFTIPPR